MLLKELNTTYDFLKLNKETKNKLLLKKEAHIEPNMDAEIQYFLFNNTLIRAVIIEDRIMNTAALNKGVFHDYELERVRKNYKKAIENSYEDLNEFKQSTFCEHIFIIKKFFNTSNELKKKLHITTNDVNYKYYFYEKSIVRLCDKLVSVEPYETFSGEAGRRFDDIRKNYQKIITQSKIEQF